MYCTSSTCLLRLLSRSFLAARRMRLNNTQRQVGLIGAAKLVNIGVRSFYFLMKYWRSLLIAATCEPDLVGWASEVAFQG
jgi:hypothetical protein